MKHFIFALVLSFVSPLRAQESQLTAEEIKASIKVFEKASAEIRRIASQSRSCEVKPLVSCTYEDFCEQLRENSDQAYIYKNADGRTVPNSLLIMAHGLLNRCIGQSESSLLMEDPYQFPDKMASEYGKKISSEKPRLEKIFADAKSRVIKILLDRETVDNKAQIQNMINRIKSVRLLLPLADDIEDVLSSGCESPNAFFKSDQNAMLLCPQMMNYPDASLFATMAHEFGHSIDPCNISHDHIKGRDGQEKLNPAFDYYLLRPSEKTSALSGGIGFEKNPLKPVIQCLTLPKSIGVEKVPLSKLLERIDADIESDKDFGISEDSDALKGKLERRSNTVAAYEKMGFCAELTGSRHIPEAFSDWISTQAVADKIKDTADSALARQIAFEAQVVFAPECSFLVNAIQNRVSSLTAESPSTCMMRWSASDSEKESATHPKTSRRINRIILAQPELQKALGCQPTDAEACK